MVVDHGATNVARSRATFLRAAPITTAACLVFGGVVDASPKKVTYYFRESPLLGLPTGAAHEFERAAEKVGLIFERPADNSDVVVSGFEVAPTGRRTRIAGWRLVRTHAADAARALPRRWTSRPLGAALLSGATAREAGLLGAGASRSRKSGAGADALR